MEMDTFVQELLENAEVPETKLAQMREEIEQLKKEVNARAEKEDGIHLELSREKEKFKALKVDYQRATRERNLNIDELSEKQEEYDRLKSLHDELKQAFRDEVEKWVREGKKAISVKYQHFINAMKAHHATKDKVKASELNVTECCANMSLLRSLVDGTSTIEGELKDAKEHLKDFEASFSYSLDDIPLFHLSDVTFTPYSELGRSDVGQMILEGVDEFGSNVGLMAGNASLDARIPPSKAETVETTDEQAETPSRQDQAQQ